MARGANQKLKILYVAKILNTTDEEHPITCEEILRYLEANGIEAERKTVYSDIEALQNFGMDIVLQRGKGYFLASRTFELPELRLLVDAVQCSRFVTQKKTLELIGKLETLCGKAQAQKLNGQVFVFNRIKAMNESIYYTVDAVQEAITDGKQITFRYFDYAADKRRVFRHDGKIYRVDPCALVWEDENYYLIAREEGVLKHFRVDKMEGITVCNQACASQERFDPADYVKGVFGMFGGERETVKLSVHNRLAGVILDRFGKEITLIPQDDEHFTVSVNVAVSPQFYSWVAGLTDQAKILSPQSVKEGMKAFLEAGLKQYRS